MGPPAAPPRLPLVAGNWKMHRGGPEAADLARAVVRELGGRAPAAVEVAILPPFPALGVVGEALKGSGVVLGAQACHGGDAGAHTGEVAAGMLAAWGCAYVLCGHSERRHAGETDAAVRERLGAALRAGLRPILCVGETLAEREAGRAAEVVRLQVAAGVAGLAAAEIARVVVAYEPVWAIGTGRNATEEQVAEAHRTVRDALLRREGADPAAAGVRVIYGGSVNPGNAEALASAPGVDGALVGGASLDAASFAAIVRAAVPETSGAARGGK